MFGYIRPLQGELKVRELERFKACYCGLCHMLGKKYGLPARFILRYEMVLLSMLLWSPDESPVIKRKRCVASPCRRKRYCFGNASLDTCAGYTMILAWWKLRDTISDERFIRTIPHRFVSLLLSRTYKKAAGEFADFDRKVREGLTSLAEYEALEGHSLDGAADKFAAMLAAAVPEAAPEAQARPMAELLYHLGRWIYIIDACDDYKEDIKAGRYNPVAARYPQTGGNISERDISLLKSTLRHSNNLLCLAFELLQENDWSEIVRNIIYLGMPDECERILSTGFGVRDE